MQHLDDLIAYIRPEPGVWFATGSEAVAWFTH